MKDLYKEMPNGYLETIQKGMSAVRTFSRHMSYGKGTREEQIARLKEEIRTADAIVLGAGAGLSTSAGFVYTGERLQKWFGDFVEKYHIPDMYSGGFMVMQLAPEISWAYWARYIYINRYMNPPKRVYDKLLQLVKDKDYFLISTDVDHVPQKVGFDKKRFFYTQGDYGLFQTVDGRNGKTYDNEEWVMKAMEAQGFVKDENDMFQVPEDGKLLMEIPTDLIPKCPDDGSDVTMNLRADDTFVEDEGWHRASAAYSDFIRRHENLHVLYLELGVGSNTPVIIKYPFWEMTLANKQAVYGCINYGEAYCPGEIEDRSICINGDIGEVLDALKA
ncbi:SIR2 family NAD-dependent protein deacylase [Lachnoclostridium sp. Marseille-P6806]|uniref:SIR2 family NAD-dependent protein deacylase n=1 Tax=Lachnoclostridium sp. Marseille-P6806 TaxID=2364793 RepID=UPI001030F690|nr:hypothetical protein [Lachnoclostridium sp. Marseille-P6806]